MNELIVSNINKYARMLAEKKYLQSGFIAVKEDDGIVITKPRIDYSDVKEDDLVFVNDKNIESLEGNFRAAAVILFCAIRQDKKAVRRQSLTAIARWSSQRRERPLCLSLTIWRKFAVFP